jgi:hypothetical protein
VLVARVAHAMEPAWNEFTLGPFSRTGIEPYARLRAQFPGARLVGYVPPVSAYYVANLHVAGTLRSYLDAMQAVSRLFDEFYDFSVPSGVTRDPANTYDGSHYYPAINARIAEVLNRGPEALDRHDPNALALPVHVLSADAYVALFEARVQQFLSGTSVAIEQAALRGALERP